MSDARTTDSAADNEPAWIRFFERKGTPFAVLVVMVLCAPGEQHLALLAGWAAWLSWGYASLLALYAGLAARLAAKRQPGDRGRRSAIAGAVIALLLAMAAQPIAHLFVTGWLSATPRPPVWLIIIVSSVPPLVLGHLLHFSGRPETRTQPVSVADKTADSIPDTVPDSWTIVPGQAKPAADRARTVVRATIPDTRTERTDSADTVSARVSAPVKTPGTVSVSAPKHAAPVSAPVSALDNVRTIDPGASSVSAAVRDMVAAGLSDSDIKDALPDAKPDSVSKAIRRARNGSGRHAATA
jgi:hypothetical protein